MFVLLWLLYTQIHAHMFSLPKKFVSISQKIEIKHIDTESREILQKLNGFYGLIGPDLERKKIKSMFDLFMGNGMIQGIFIENGELTFVKNEIKTDKRNLETFQLPQKKIFPNIMGVANTAFLQWNNKTYALFERDHPYEIHINKETKQIETVGKKKIEGLAHFSAHPKIKHTYVETIDYDVLRKKTTVFQYDHEFRLLSSLEIPMKYFPIIHDFISTRDSMVCLNSAFMWNISILPRLTGKFQLDNIKPGIFFHVDRNTGKIIRYYTEKGIYIFHYADVYETENEMEIYAPIYESLDFSNLKLEGKYRKIILDKRTNKIHIEKNMELEKWNVEFPVPFLHENKKKILLRCVDTEQNTGFMICHQLEIEKVIFFPGKCICGEPSIVEIEEIPYAVFFTVDNNDNGFFTIVNIITEQKIEINLYMKLQIGFHAIYTQTK